MKCIFWSWCAIFYFKKEITILQIWSKLHIASLNLISDILLCYKDRRQKDNQATWTGLRVPTETYRNLYTYLQFYQQFIIILNTPMPGKYGAGPSRRSLQAAISLCQKYCDCSVCYSVDAVSHWRFRIF